MAKFEQVLSNKILSEHVLELKKDMVDGKQYDTKLRLQGSLDVAGDTINDFVDELEELILKYKI